MPADSDSKMQTYLVGTVFVGTASNDLTTNVVKEMAALTGDATARLKAILAAAGAPN